jgi:hypothetical protein
LQGLGSLKGVFKVCNFTRKNKHFGQRQGAEFTLGETSDRAVKNDFFYAFPEKRWFFCNLFASKKTAIFAFFVSFCRFSWHCTLNYVKLQKFKRQRVKNTSKKKKHVIYLEYEHQNNLNLFDKKKFQFLFHC